MPAQYGYRVYKVCAYKNSTQKPKEPIPVDVSSEVPRMLFEVLEVLSDRPSYFFATRRRSDRAEGTPQLPEDSISIGPPAWVNASTIVLVVSQGQKDAHRFATRPNRRKRKNLAGHSAEVEHFVSFHFPLDADATEFLFVSQTYRRKDVRKRLLQIISIVSRELRDARIEEEKRVREQCRKDRIEPPPKGDHWRFAFQSWQANDDDYIDDILGAAKSVSATFTAYAPSDRGGAATVVEKTLTVKFTSDAMRTAGRELSRRWTARRREKRPISRQDALNELVTELSAKGFLKEDEKLEEYNRSQINVNAGMASTTIAVDALKDVFTYPVHNGKPDAEFFFSKVLERLGTIARQEDVEIAKVSASEVAECLVVSD